MALPQRSHRDYTIGWICALSVEMAAAKAMLDEVHPRLPTIRGDKNVYVLGSIHGHNVVLTCLPAGVYGTSSASIVATQMQSTFLSIRFSLLVGIGGGVPTGNADVRLGDVVVSKPTGTFGGVVQYDYGKTIDSGQFQRTGALNKPPVVLLNALAHLEANHMVGSSQVPFYLSQMLHRYPNMHKFTHPGSLTDLLFKSRYRHAVATETNCLQCSPRYLIPRVSRGSNDPVIHYGVIASGNQVMRDGLTRDHVVHSLREPILCFEMEAAGLMDHLPCLVIRGICDYADSHKNKSWQPYAAATAAAYAKELLAIIPIQQPRTAKTVKFSAEDDTRGWYQRSGHLRGRKTRKGYTESLSRRNGESKHIRQAEAIYQGPVSNYGGVVMGNITSSRKGVNIVGSSTTISSQDVVQ